MNPEFEQKVNNSIEQTVIPLAQPIAGVPLSSGVGLKKSRSAKKLLILLLFCFIGFAFLLILRAIFLQNPPLFDNNSLIGQILNPNTVTSLNGLELSKAESVINDFTKNLKSEFQPIPNLKTRTLIAYTSNSTVIGNLDSSGSFSKVAEIANIIKVHRYYDDDTYLYSINIPDISQSELYLNTKGNKPVLVRRLDREQRFIDAHFALLDKSFYYTFIDSNNTVYLQATDLKGQNYTIYSSNFLKASASIWSVDIAAGYVYLNQGIECFSLMLRDKLLNPYPCEKIQSNSNNNFYWSNQSSTGIYTSFTRGEIYKFTYGELERKVLTTKFNGQVAHNLWLNGDSLYYILGDLNSTGERSWSFVPSDIRKINVSTTEDTTLNIKNIRADINSIIALENNLFVITQEFFGKNKLYTYNSSPIIPVSYPLSYPESYPQVINLDQYYWTEVDLGVNYNKVEVVQPVYTYIF